MKQKIRLRRERKPSLRLEVARLYFRSGTRQDCHRILKGQVINGFGISYPKWIHATDLKWASFFLSWVWRIIRQEWLWNSFERKKEKKEKEKKEKTFSEETKSLYNFVQIRDKNVYVKTGKHAYIYLRIVHTQIFYMGPSQTGTRDLRARTEPKKSKIKTKKKKPTQILSWFKLETVNKKQFGLHTNLLLFIFACFLDRTSKHWQIHLSFYGAPFCQCTKTRGKFTRLIKWSTVIYRITLVYWQIFINEGASEDGSFILEW